MLVIPVINIEPLFGNDIEAKMNVARQIDEVCRVSGFFQIKNHGISTQSLEALTSKTFDFFKKLTTEQKMSMASKKLNSSNSHLYRGYFPASVNGKDISSFEDYNSNNARQLSVAEIKKILLTLDIFKDKIDI